MASYQIPLSALASQQAQVTLEGSVCRYWIRQLATGLYLDFWVSGEQVIAGCLCVNGVDIFRGHVPQLSGKLYFIDTQGSSDPVYTGLLQRFALIYAS